MTSPAAKSRLSEGSSPSRAFVVEWRKVGGRVIVVGLLGAGALHQISGDGSGATVVVV